MADVQTYEVDPKRAPFSMRLYDLSYADIASEDE
jgi:hypothetical protein